MLRELALSSFTEQNKKPTQVQTESKKKTKQILPTCFQISPHPHI